MTTTKQELGKDLVYIILASVLMSVGLAMFTIPNNIVPGGLSGLATALAAITPVSVAAWNLIINIPLLILAVVELGWFSTFKTMISVVTLSLFLTLAQKILPVYSTDPLIAAVLGGAFIGLGDGLLVSRGANSGGTDIAAVVLAKHHPGLSLGTFFTAVNAAVVLFGAIVFRDIDVAIYSALSIFAVGKVIDYITQGVNFGKAVYIITDKGDKLVKDILDNIDRGITVLPSVGGYTRKESNVLMTVVRRQELPSLLRVIKASDPNAFAWVVDSTEVWGERFSALKDAG